jgi:hypothetical protein
MKRLWRWLFGTKTILESKMKKRFEIRPPLVVVHADEPGQNVHLAVGEDKRFVFRGDVSSFDDERHEYAWAFEGTVSDGDHLTFSTDTWTLTGEVQDGEVHLHLEEEEVDEAELMAGESKPVKKAKRAPAAKKKK